MPDGTSPAHPEKYLEVERLKCYYPIRRGVMRRVVGHVKAVDGVTFDIARGETLGLVGESGCGKTTIGRAILRLMRPTDGAVRLQGEDVGELAKRDNAALRRRLQIVFQDPYGSLNPRMNVGDIIGEAPLFHGLVPRAELPDYVADIMRKVGLRPENRAKYPHEFSGGQRQRIGIARALAMRPEFVVCDEPVSALDVSIQSQVLNLLADLREEFRLTYLFISHDLSVVRHISDRVAVLYLGKLVEIAPKETFFREPLHPYSQALLSAVPEPDPELRSERIVLTGDLPSPIDPPPGCILHTRCPHAMPRCAEHAPQLAEYRPGHATACFLYS